MTTRKKVPGLLTDSAVLMRFQAGNDPALKGAIINHDYEQDPESVYMKLPAGTSDSLHSIYAGDIVVTGTPEYRRAISGEQDSDSNTQGRLPVYAQAVGLPSWPAGVKYAGAHEDREQALRDHLLCNLRFAGVSAGNHFQGGEQSTPYSTGVPINLWGLRTMYLPVTKAISPMQPVKLAIPRKTLAAEMRDGVPFTVEPVTSESIARQMMTASRIYADSVTNGRELLFTNLDKQSKMMASLTMRKECEVGHVFMLGILGSALKVATVLLGDGDVAQKNALAVFVGTFNDVFLHTGVDDAKTEATKKALGKIAEKTESKASAHGKLIDNIQRNGLRHVALAVSEQILSPHNQTIGKIIQEEDGGSSGGDSYRKFVLNYGVM